MRRLSLGRGTFLGGIALGLGAWLTLSGCGGEPTGEDAYSQKFEKPEGAPEGTGDLPDTYSEKRAEIEKAQSEPAKPARKK